MTESHFESMYHWWQARAKEFDGFVAWQGEVVKSPLQPIWYDEASNFDKATVSIWWGADYARDPEKHKPFPANALTDTRTVTMGEPSKVLSEDGDCHGESTGNAVGRPDSRPVSGDT